MVLTTIRDAMSPTPVEGRRVVGFSATRAPRTFHIAVGTNPYLVAITAVGSMAFHICIAALQPATG
jgi:hypothetical protein